MTLPPAGAAPGSYYVVAGRGGAPLRHVVPYFHTFDVDVKGRWVGRTLVEVFSAEFPHHSESYYQHEVARGRLTLTRPPTRKGAPPLQGTGNEIIRLGDRMTHTVHRHELAVFATSIEILKYNSTLGLLAVSKPASMPVHPCGRYSKNTVLGVLNYCASPAGAALSDDARSQYVTATKGCGLENDDVRALAAVLKEAGGVFHTVHRLDKCTSGVLLLCTTLEAARAMDVLLRRGEDDSDTGQGALHSKPRKVYLARVCGHFPDTPITVDKPIYCADHRAGRFACLEKDEGPSNLKRSREDESEGRPAEDSLPPTPTAENDKREKRHAMEQHSLFGQTDKNASAFAKRAVTRFVLVHYLSDADESIVRCEPQTGRTQPNPSASGKHRLPHRGRLRLQPSQSCLGGYRLQMFKTRAVVARLLIRSGGALRFTTRCAPSVMGPSRLAARTVAFYIPRGRGGRGRGRLPYLPSCSGNTSSPCL